MNKKNVKLRRSLMSDVWGYCLSVCDGVILIVMEERVEVGYMGNKQVVKECTM
jgi:hypothetical protein